MLKDPTAEQANLYMEMCAALMNLMGENEVVIERQYLPMTPFQILRKFDQDNQTLHLRLIVE